MLEMKLWLVFGGAKGSQLVPLNVDKSISSFINFTCISQVVCYSLQYLKIENGWHPILHWLRIDSIKVNVVAMVLESLIFSFEPTMGVVRFRSCAHEGEGNVVLNDQALWQKDNHNVGLCRKWEDYHMNYKWDRFSIDNHVDLQLLLPPSTFYDKISLLETPIRLQGTALDVF
jgi:hypothetical protein